MAPVIRNWKSSIVPANIQVLFVYKQGCEEKPFFVGQIDDATNRMQDITVAQARRQFIQIVAVTNTALVGGEAFNAFENSPYNLKTSWFQERTDP